MYFINLFNFNFCIFLYFFPFIFQPDGSLERLVKESEMLSQSFGHLFDLILVNNDIDETIRQLERVVEKLSATPQWVPISWVY
ncbi:unnamed protein product [Meloidogyne enterolobii]|uniref:Uncharacterized protein n=1 Tax=Meloidogyne enterolobii TaxID=390850 RepID=A0ACB0YZU4_MELEN